MSKPTESDIVAEIAALKAMKPSIRRISGFGDGNHDAIDVQLRVLEGRMSVDLVSDKYENATNHRLAFRELGTSR